jgi:hypothetical protein
MTNQVTFSGSLDRVLKWIEDYKEKGYSYKSGIGFKDKYGKKYSVTMVKEQPSFTITIPGSVIIQELERIHSNEKKQRLGYQFERPISLQDKLNEAVEKEDYELACKLRDKLQGK